MKSQALRRSKDCESTSIMIGIGDLNHWFALRRQNAGRPVRRPDCTLATVDHNIPSVSSSVLCPFGLLYNPGPSLVRISPMRNHLSPNPTHEPSAWPWRIMLRSSDWLTLAWPIDDKVCLLNKQPAIQKANLTQESCTSLVPNKALQFVQNHISSIVSSSIWYS
jgi:hypothetical protein